MFFSLPTDILTSSCSVLVVVYIGCNMFEHSVSSHLPLTRLTSQHFLDCAIFIQSVLPSLCYGEVICLLVPGYALVL